MKEKETSRATIKYPTSGVKNRESGIRERNVGGGGDERYWRRAALTGIDGALK